MNASPTPKKPETVKPATTQQPVNEDEIPTVILVWHPTGSTATK